MQKIIKWFAPFVALGVAIFIIFFLISINSFVEFGEDEPLTFKRNIVQTKPEKVWLNHFSKTQRLGYSYPVNEVYVQIDLKEKITKPISYKLSASHLDSYQIFCLKEELKQHKLKYYLKKDKKNIELLIYSKDINRLKSLVKVLKNYKISATLKPYKEEE